MITRETHLAAILAAFTAAVLIFTLMQLTGCVAPAIEPVAVVPSSPAVKSASCCDQAWPGTHAAGSHDTRLTGYYPFNNAMEGGLNDRYGVPLRTLQAIVAGQASYVSVAMDKTMGKVKRKLCSPDLDSAYGKPLPLLVVDTGGAFTGKGWGRADICTANKSESLKHAVNTTVKMLECE